MGNLAFAHTNLPKREDPMGNRVYAPPLRGVRIYSVCPLGLSSPPTPMLCPVREQDALPVLCQGLPAACQGNSGRMGEGRGCWRAARNTQRFLASSGLEYISTRLLVYLSSRMLDFRAA